MTTATKNRMSAPQRAYALAKAAYDAAHTAMNAKLDAEFPPEMFTDAWYTPEQRELLRRYGARAEVLAKERDVAEFRSLLRQAESCLLEWGHGKVKRLPGYSLAVKELFEVHVGKRADIREELIQLTLNLSA
jgi:hypothetical protein